MTMKLLLTITAILLFNSVFAQQSICKLNYKPIVLQREQTIKMPLAPKIVASTSVLAIGLYGYKTNTKVMPSMVGVGLLYGAYHVRKEYKDNSFIPLIFAGLGCFAIQSFVINNHKL